MKNFFLLFICIPFFSIAQQNADSAFIKQISNNILSSKASYTNLYYLTKHIGGRLAGSPQMVLAENWGAKALAEAGADNVIKQECMVPHWVRGSGDKAVLYYTVKGKKIQRNLSMVALGNSFASPAGGVTAGIVRVKNYDDLEQQKDAIKGKIVFYDVPFDDTLIETSSAYGKNVGYRGSGASRAAKYGAVGMLLRSMTNGTDNFAHTGSMHYDEKFPIIPAAAIGLQDVDFIDSLFDAGMQPTALLLTHGKMLPDTIGHNIIGVLKGSSNADEIITIGGHLDSWDVNEGATDDGAGIAQTIEILRAFKALGYTPKHTIHFVLFANEENGARGGAKYADAAKAANEKHIFALESDGGGFTPRGFSFIAPTPVIHKFQTWLPLFKPYGVTYLDAGGAGTDVDPIINAYNMPGGELRPDSQRYFDVHHAPNDVLENVNARELKLGAINMAALIYLIDKYGL